MELSLILINLSTVRMDFNLTIIHGFWITKPISFETSTDHCTIYFQSALFIRQLKALTSIRNVHSLVTCQFVVVSLPVWYRK